MTTFIRNFIDLSHPLNSGTQIYPSDPVFSIRPHATHEKDAYCVHQLSCGTHTGTHIDAPYHFIANGKRVDEMSLDMFVSEAVVVDLSNATRFDESGPRKGLKARERITWEDLEPYAPLLQPGRMLLINTGWSKTHYGTDRYFDHPYLTPNVASNLIARGVKLVGTDTLNPDETPSPTTGAECADGFRFHEAFLGAGCTIAENLTNLEELIEAQKDTSDNKWIVHMVPLNLTGADGSPVRAFAYRL